MNVRIPKITSVEAAVRIYWENTELGNQELYDLFGNHGRDLFCRLKRVARDKMAEYGWESFCAHSVNTKAAYEAWGLDINDLESRLKKIQKLEKARGNVG